MSKWIFDGHPQRYHVAALLFSFIAIILVQQTERFTATATTGVACTYTYGSWGSCQSDSKRYRSVITQTPDGCVQATAPTVSESCNYTADVPATTACTYTYGSWGDCMSGGRRYRSVITQTPVGCVQTAAPYVSESCNYTADATASTPTSTTACTYTYNSWGSCQSNSRRYRSVITQTPVGCVQTAAPYVSESCNYTATATTACTYTYGSWGSCQSDSKRYRSVITQTPDGCVQATAPTVSESCAYTATDATASTTTSATACAYTYSSWGACQEHNKRIREVTSKLPVNCIEYTEPAVEQSCVYDSAITATTSISATSSSGTTASTVTTTTHDVTGVVTPIFTFVDVAESMTFRGAVEIQGSVQGASAVEYYLVLVGSNTHKYIGSARQISHLIWSLNFRSEDVPNGEFYLRAKIKNKYGEYGSGQRRIYIANVGTTSKTATSDDFVALDMTSEEKQRMLKGIAEELEIPIHESVQSPDEQKKYIFDYCQSHRGECFPERDSDDDGLNDIDEVRYGTNPKSPDSDLDGFIDGDEVKGGFDPVKYSAGDQSDRIAFESPRTSGETKANIYIVKNIELKESYDAETGETKRNLHLTGKGLPNSFVTLYIFSDPIILTVKTDSEGNWTYELDKELENGEHGAYVAITDNTGKITGKSEPIAFVKTAEAVTVIPAASAVNAETTRPVTQHRANRDIFLLIAIMVSALAVALAVIGLVRHKHDNSRVEVS